MNAARLASSSCVPKRPRGLRFLASSSNDFTGIRRENAPSVGIGPGAIAFKRMPRLPHSTAGAFSRLMPVKSLEELAKKRNPLGRFGTHEELANLAAFMVSDQSGYINGEVVVMDGGEWLQGAGEFNHLGRLLTEEQWQALKPKKKGST